MYIYIYLFYVHIYVVNPKSVCIIVRLQGMFLKRQQEVSAEFADCMTEKYIYLSIYLSIYIYIYIYICTATYI